MNATIGTGTASLLQHQNSSPVFSVAQSLVFCVLFVTCYLSFCPFSLVCRSTQVQRTFKAKRKFPLYMKLEAQWTEPVSFIFHSVLRKLYTEPSIDASYQIAVYLATRFQRRFFQKSTNQKQELPVVSMFVYGLGRNEQSLQRTFHRCFLPSFGSFGQMVSEEKI